MCANGHRCLGDLWRRNLENNWLAREGQHFYNSLDGIRYDFTAGQFSMPDYSYELTYEDQQSNVEEAKRETNSGQVDALRQAFRRAFNEAT